MSYFKKIYVLTLELLHGHQSPRSRCHNHNHQNVLDLKRGKLPGQHIIWEVFIYCTESLCAIKVISFFAPNPCSSKSADLPRKVATDQITKCKKTNTR